MSPPEPSPRHPPEAGPPALPVIPLAPTAGSSSVLGYADLTTPPPSALRSARRPIPPEARPVAVGLALLLVSMPFDADAVFAGPVMACVGWYVALRLRRERAIPLGWRWGMGLAACLTAGAAFVACSTLGRSPYWWEYVWAQEPAVRRGAYAGVAGVLAFVACIAAGRHRSSRRPPASLPTVLPAAGAAPSGCQEPGLDRG